MLDKESVLKNLRQELRKGTLVIAVLSQLGEKHYGYSLVESLNKEGLQIDQSTLYPLLRRLNANGLLTATWEMVEPRPRKYYHLSEMGKDILEELTLDFNSNFEIVKKLLREDK